MFMKKKKPCEKTGLEEAREEALSVLASFSAENDEYKKIMEHVKTLSHLIDLEKSERLSPNTIAIILGNAAIALVVVGYERANVVTSKAITFMQKLK